MFVFPNAKGQMPTRITVSYLKVGGRVLVGRGDLPVVIMDKGQPMPDAVSSVLEADRRALISAPDQPAPGQS